MNLAHTLVNEIVAKLMPLDPTQVVLFGSYAYGEPQEDSDIDLYIVTKDDFVPQNWNEKNQVHLKVAKALEEIVRKYPTDLVVHTKPMHREFVALDSSFAKEIVMKGIKLYESA